MKKTNDLQAADFGHRHPAVYGTEREMTLYYDETNNIRKLRLRDDGLNTNKHENFVLGGIVLLPGQTIGDINALRKALHIQPSADEIKFDMVAKNDFEKNLSSRKLTTFLTWLDDRKIGIHYINLNLLNWFILDVIESIMADDEFDDILPMHRELKNELYGIAMADLPGFLSLLHGYGFPDIPRSRTGAFIRELEAFVQKNWPLEPNEATRMLSYVLTRARVLKELVFLVDETPGELIDGFENIFLNRICTFNNAKHVLDEEKEIQAALAPFRLMNGEREMDYTFVDSKKVPEVQLSDVVVGLLGKYFTFIEKTPYSALVRIRQNLNPIQKRNLGLLKSLIEFSDEVSNSLLFRITTMDSDWKSDAFLFDLKPPPHLMKR